MWLVGKCNQYGLTIMLILRFRMHEYQTTLIVHILTLMMDKTTEVYYFLDGNNTNHENNTF